MKGNRAKSAIIFIGIQASGKSNYYRQYLQETFEATLCIASRGKYNEEEYPLYVAGIREVYHFGGIPLFFYRNAPF